uniref:Protein PTHB1-like n=1 Tax=Phallusia mammillata TaxID=59560 RepID=A0A6F9D805_9ASCI|nr:protein PTHB1-like [Phallusia mammillata]
MSLFQTNEWWASNQSLGEECGHGCLCVANIDNSSDGLCKVITGSYQGILRMYAPTSESAHQAHDVLIEMSLQLPILQLAAGKFNSVSPDLHLAVLHPRLLVVYKVSMSEGAINHGNQYKMDKVYQHKLERTAANMTYGPFGGVQNQDFICVQSMDGALSIFEHETFTFTRFLPGFLLPGPICFNPRTDSFLTVSSSMFLESYSYQVLAVATDSSKKEESQSMASGKKITVDWKFNLGEFVLEIVVLQLSTGKSVIVVLGERALFCLEESGQLRFMKKFEYNVSCFKALVSSESDTIRTIICTHSQQLLVYDNVKMKWAAKLRTSPNNLAIGNFKDTNGLLVLLTESCQVSCCFLGTAPTIFSLPRSKQREIDIGTLDERLNKLNTVIAKVQSTQGDVIISKKETEDLKVSVEVPKILDKKSAASKYSGPEIPSISVQVLLKVNRRVTNVQLSIESNPAIHCTLQQLSLQELTESEHPPSIRPAFYLRQDFVPSYLSQDVTVHYQQTTGIPKVAMATIKLPLLLVAKNAAPVKKLDHRVTLESNMACVNLMEIFADFCCETSGPHCIGFEYYSGPKATILTSKTSNRYRVQCDTYDGLWLITNELVDRLRALRPDIHLTVQDQPSLEEYAHLIDLHYQLRVTREEIRLVLEQRALQFRAIQRRLLSRFKDKTPAPLNCLDTLLEGTHTQILAVADALTENEEALKMCSCSLSSATRLIVLLCTLWRELSEGEAETLSAVLCVNQTYNKNNMGWEEMVDIGITSLLRTSMSSKSGRDPNVTSAQHSVEFPLDTAKLKKHLMILMDKLAKGAHLPSSNTKKSTKPKYIEKPKQVHSKKTNDVNTFFDDSFTNEIDSKENPYANLDGMLPPDDLVYKHGKKVDCLESPNYSTIPNGNLDEEDEDLPLYNGDHLQYETPLDVRLPPSAITDDIESPLYYEDTDIFS